ncbi:MAG: recombinase family protein [bacterium]|nr:recombinase family protein [bacterium]
MSDRTKITPAHTCRAAFVYLRQSSPGQMVRNRESTDRQYGLVHRALEFGWTREQTTVIDEDLGVTGSGVVARSGFAHMIAEVALGHVGLVLALEVSRVARNNAEWYRLLDLCGITDTLIGDSDGLYHPGDFNDRLLLGLKGTMSEAELHVLRARLDGGIRNKAARGELRRGLPVGLVWGDQDGEVRFHPDEAVTGAIRTVFERFTELGSVRQVWLWFLSQDLSFPLQSNRWPDIQWVKPSYHAIHRVLKNPTYGGAYAHGKTRHERYIDESGRVRKRVRRLPRCEWQVLIPDHHQGFIDWETYEANQERIARNRRPQRHQAGGAVREGAALLQSIARCGRCNRRLRVSYPGKGSSPSYYCPGHTLVDGRGSHCLRVGGRQIDQAVAETLLAALLPAGIEASLEAADQLEADRDAALAQWRLEVERTRYEAERAERRYLAVEPENRLVARTLESEWNHCLRDLAAAEAELARREQRTPRKLSEEDYRKLRELGQDLERVWSAPTTSARDRKQLLQTLVEDVLVCIDPAASRAQLTLRWRGGAFTELEIELKRVRKSPVRTDEDTVELLRRLAVHYPDAMIAGIFNRQGRRTARGHRFNANRVGNLRRHRKIPRYQPPPEPPEGELANVAEAAKILGVAPSTVHRWLNDGFIAGEQLTPGAPWRIRITEDLRSRFVEEAPEGWLPMLEATKVLGVSRQTVLQRVKRGELQAVHVRQGRRKGLRIKVLAQQPTLFDQPSQKEV